MLGNFAQSFIYLHTPKGLGDGGEGPEGVDSSGYEAMEAKNTEKMRKEAGLPELPDDYAPSSCAKKVLYHDESAVQFLCSALCFCIPIFSCLHRSSQVLLGEKGWQPQKSAGEFKAVSI